MKIRKIIQITTLLVTITGTIGTLAAMENSGTEFCEHNINHCTDVIINFYKKERSISEKRFAEKIISSLIKEKISEGYFPKDFKQQEFVIKNFILSGDKFVQKTDHFQTLHTISKILETIEGNEANNRVKIKNLLNKEEIVRKKTVPPQQQRFILCLLPFGGKWYQCILHAPKKIPITPLNQNNKAKIYKKRKF